MMEINKVIKSKVNTVKITSTTTIMWRNPATGSAIVVAQMSDTVIVTIKIQYVQIVPQ